MLLILALVIVQASVQIPGKAPEQTASSGQQIEGNSTSHKSRTPTASPQGQNNTPSDQPKTGNVEQKPNEVDVRLKELPVLPVIKTEPDKVYRWLTAALVLIGAFTLGAIWYQAKQTARAAKAAADSVEAINRQAGIMERQTAATEIAANAARDNIDLLIKKERVRISVCLDNLSDPEFLNRTVSISYKVRLLGPTLPRSIVARAEAHAVLDTFPRLWPMEEIQFVKTVEATQSREAIILVSNAIEDVAVFEKIKNGEVPIIFEGFIFYLDIFQSGTDQPHETIFRYKWIGRGGLVPSFWEKDGGREKNHET